MEIPLIPTYRVYRVYDIYIYFSPLIIILLKNEQKVGMLQQKRVDTRGVGISKNYKKIYIYTSLQPHPYISPILPPANHTHKPHPYISPTPQLSSILFTLHKVYKSMDDNCGECVECMVWLVGAVSRKWVESMGVVNRRWMWVEYMGVDSGCGCKEDPYSSCTYSSWICSFLQQHPYFCSLFMFSFLFLYFCI